MTRRVFTSLGLGAWAALTTALVGAPLPAPTIDSFWYAFASVNNVEYTKACRKIENLVTKFAPTEDRDEKIGREAAQLESVLLGQVERLQAIQARAGRKRPA